MLIKLRERMTRDEGFTLVELLVVMLILGILAAIAIPAFFNQRDKARDADAKSGVRTAQTAMETYATDNDGKYTGATVALLQKIEPTLADSTLGAPTVTDTTYSVVVTSPTGNKFTISRSGGATTYTCTTEGDAGCPSDGQWAGGEPAA